MAGHRHSSPSSWWQQGLSEEAIIGLWHQGTIPRRLRRRKSHFFTFLAHHNKQDKSVTSKKAKGCGEPNPRAALLWLTWLKTTFSLLFLNKLPQLWVSGPENTQQLTATRPTALRHRSRGSQQFDFPVGSERGGKRQPPGLCPALSPAHSRVCRCPGEALLVTLLSQG